MSTIETLCTDVLVLGGGGAALRAAIAAAESQPGSRVLLATKGILGRSGVTATACSDRMAFHATLAATDPGDREAWRKHADDVYRIGGYVSDYDLALVQAEAAASAFEYLDGLGVPWVRRDDGTPDQFVTDGSEVARACYTGPYTANHIEQVLVRRARELANLQVLEQAGAIDLLSAEDGGVGGAMLLVGERRVAVPAGAVVLATGGAGRVFGTNVFPPDCTGDGYALAYRAGAELVNVEFIQLGLCSVTTGLAMSGSMMRALPRLVNDLGEEFLSRYLPPDTTPSQMYGILFNKGASWPVSAEQPSHVIDIAVTYERARGRRVFLDFALNPAQLEVAALPTAVRNWYRDVKDVDLEQEPYRSQPLSRLQAINRPSVEWLRERGVDLAAGDRAEIAPAAQHFQGGVKIRTDAATTLTGLFAAGEVAGGQHGANRPGGNALMDAQVFGRIAGESASRLARERRTRLRGDSIAGAQARLDGLLRGANSSAALRRRVQSLMDRHCAVVRTTEGLEAGLEELRELGRQTPSAHDCGLQHAVETDNIIVVAEMVLRAALARDESRGPHLRFGASGAVAPLGSSPAWRKYLVIRQQGQSMLIEERRPVEPQS